MPARVENNTAFDIESIQRKLPHRYPFLLVDRVLELKKNESVTALKNVSFNEPFFQGHFPGYKIMPGVLIVEALAQTGGILLFCSLPDPEGKLVFLSKINNTRFRRPVVPGDQLILKVDLLKFKAGFSQIRGTAYVDGTVVAESEMMASLVDVEDLHGSE